MGKGNHRDRYNPLIDNSLMTDVSFHNPKDNDEIWPIDMFDFALEEEKD